VACLGIVAPEALAIPIAAKYGWASWGGVLMASPIVGAILGILIIGRRDVHQQNRSIVPLALAMPLPLLATALHPPIVVVAALFLVSGMCQAFMVPLQATFALVTEPELRGRIFSLAGSVSIAAAGVAFLVAGWVGAHTSPSAGVAICAGVCLVLIVLLAISWPHGHVRHAVERAYAPTSRAA
jgi:MFS family permease